MGGNVFTGSSKIDKSKIKPTLQEFFREMRRIFPDAPLSFSTTALLGSSGKADDSGDIDLGVSESVLKNLEDWGLDESRVYGLLKQYKAKAKTSTDSQLKKRAILMAIAEKVEKQSNIITVNTKSSGAGTLFFQFPQYVGKNERNSDKKVQIDLNVGNLDWLKFSYYSDRYEEKNVKGLHRTQLIAALFLNKGYSFYHNLGVKNKETDKFEITSPDEAVKALSELYDCPFTLEILNNYWKLTEFIEKHLDEDDLQKTYKIYLHILDHTKDVDIPDGEVMNYWLDHQEDWGLTGKFLPTNSKLYVFRDI